MPRHSMTLCGHCVWSQAAVTLYALILYCICLGLCQRWCRHILGCLGQLLLQLDAWHGVQLYFGWLELPMVCCAETVCSAAQTVCVVRLAGCSNVTSGLSDC
jgi:hypothetical protein